MSKLSISDIEKVSRLSRIALTDTEKEQMTIELGSILNFVETLQAADTTGVEPTAQVTGLVDVLREDVVRKCDIPPTELLGNVPAMEDGYIKAPKVL